MGRLIEEFDQKGLTTLEQKPRARESSLSRGTAEEEDIPDIALVTSSTLRLNGALSRVLPDEVDNVDEVDKVVEVAELADTTNPTADEGYFIRIDNRSGKGLGVGVGVQKNVGLGTWTQGGLKINKISKKGLVHKWNVSNKSQEVVVGDILVEVNSVTGSPTRLLDEMGKELVLNVRLLRPDDFCEVQNSRWSGWSGWSVS